MNKEEMKTKMQKILELKEPVFIEKLAPALSKYAQIVYLIGLVILAFAILGSIIALFGSPMAALGGLLFTLIEFVLLRMFCEFLVTYKK
ncbi:MAG: hypothetical protein IJY58_04980 [Alphaproteobacteria bacterium]|nr:hypothetical protein [Alphaproteobacteria bacterium]